MYRLIADKTMKRILFLFVAVLFASVTLGQANTEQQRTAIFIIPNEHVDNELRRAVENQVLMNLQRAGQFLIVERNAEFRAEVDRELGEFILSGTVRDSDVVQLGQQFGAEIVCIVEVGNFRGTYTIDVRIVNVETGVTVRSGHASGNLNTLPGLRTTVATAIGNMLGLQN